MPRQHSDAGSHRPGYEIAAERILEYIVRERLEPGDRLPTEKDLAEAVNTFLSATVVSVQRLQRQVSAIGLAGVAGGSLAVAAEQHLAISAATASSPPTTPPPDPHHPHSTRRTTCASPT